MTRILSILASDIFPILAIAGIGFVLARHLGAQVRTLSRTVFYALAPCLAFHMLASSPIASGDFGRMVAFSVLITAAIGVAAWAAARPFRPARPEFAAFLMVVMFSNGGNYGLPLVLFAFGREALAHAAVYFVTTTVLIYTVGVFLAAAGRRSLTASLTGLVRVPVLYGLLAGVFVLWLGRPVPAAIGRPVQLLADAALPTMMLVLGMQIERVRKPEQPGLVAMGVLLSLVVTPLLSLGLTEMLGLTGAARQAAVLEASTPAAVATTILSLEFDIAPNLVTSTVFFSTILSPFTLAPLVAWLERLG